METSKANGLHIVSRKSSSSTENMTTKETERGEWGGQIEFILTCVGFSVGLGNVWRFPYLAYENGGGAFLIPYFLTLIFVGLPLYVMELTFGQFASLGTFTIWKINPLFKGVGLASIIVCIYILIYFNVIISWCLYFMFSAMQTQLPWTKCDNAWNTPACTTTNFTDTSSTTPSEEFYYRHVLEISDGIGTAGSVRWQLLLLLFLSWVIVFLVLLKGISSLGKVSYVITVFPYVLLTCMLVRGATLEGAIQGIEFYMTPDFEKLKDLKVWGAAATQIFYSLGVGMGNLIALASYNKFNNNIVRDGVLIPIINCLTSVYAGFVIFSVLGYMANEKGVPVDEVATSGPGLVFVVYPEGLATMPIPQLWSVLFFLMMMFIGFSSQFSQAESVISALLDEFHSTLRVGNRPVILRGVFCLFLFLCGIPMVTQGGFYLFQLVNDYCSTYSLLVITFLEVAALLWIYGYRRFSEDFALMLGRNPPWYFRICWLVITPLGILAVLIFSIIQTAPLSFNGVTYPDWGMTLAWLVAMFPIVAIVLVALYQYCTRGGLRLLVEVTRPELDWGPALDSNRRGVYAEQDLRRQQDSQHDLSYIYAGDVMLGVNRLVENRSLMSSISHVSFYQGSYAYNLNEMHNVKSA